MNEKYKTRADAQTKKNEDFIMNEPKISIIIPVYKTEKYLDECMKSVFSQNYPNIEVILVDDGSPDNCPALCDKYAKNYDFVKAVHQKNMGLGLSRNTGLDAAKGEYVFFLDSDDCLDGEDAISVLAKKAAKTGADIVVGCFRRFNDKMKSMVNSHHLRGGKYTKTVDFRFTGFIMYGHLSYNWGKIYKKKFLDENGLRCGDYPFTQDKAHNMACCACSPKYAFVDQSVYMYRVNDESVTYKYKKNFTRVWLSIAYDFIQFLNEKKIEEDYGDLVAFHICVGSFFLVKQELVKQELVKQELGDRRHRIGRAASALKKYSSDPLVKKVMGELVSGKYIRDIRSVSWKIVIFAAAALMRARLYVPYVFGIALILGARVDERVTKSRYKKPKSGK